MKRLVPGLVFCAVVSSAAVSGAVGGAGVALAAPQPPYTDHYTHGYIGLCDAAGHNVTHGSVYDKPFVWRAVSSVPAPPSMRGTGQKATFYAFQPRAGVDPSVWSGDSLTASSRYSNAAHPMAQATRRDFALSDYLDELPATWNGMVELRMLFSAPQRGVDNTIYPATDIQVTGTTWTVVRGGSVDCNAGRAVSPESRLPASNHAGLAPPTRLKATPVANEAKGDAGASASGDGSQTAAVEDGSRRTNNVGALIALVVAAAAAVAGLGSWLRSRRRSAGPGA